jgi:predicted histidine transporter YuiF (NhaC family)
MLLLMYDAFSTADCPLLRLTMEKRVLACFVTLAMRNTYILPTGYRGALIDFVGR